MNTYANRKPCVVPWNLLFLAGVLSLCLAREALGATRFMFQVRNNTGQAVDVESETKYPTYTADTYTAFANGTRANLANGGHAPGTLAGDSGVNGGGTSGSQYIDLPSDCSAITAKIRTRWRPTGSGSYSAWTEHDLTESCSGIPSSVQQIDINSAPPTYCGRLNLYNNTASPVGWILSVNGSPVLSVNTVAPGGAYLNYDIGPVASSSGNTVSLGVYQGGSLVETKDVSGSVNWYACGGTVTPTSVDTDPTPIPSGSGSADDSPIDFANSDQSGSGVAADNKTLKTGFDALARQLDSILKAVNSGDRDNDGTVLSSIESKLTSGNSKLDTLLGQTDGLETGLNSIGTKLDTANGKLQSIDDATRGGTNLLGGVSDKLSSATNYLRMISTNFQGVAGDGGAVDGKAGTVGDYSGRQGFAEGEAGSELSGVEGNVPAPGTSLPSANTSLLTVTGMGGTWNLNPLAEPTVGAVAPWIRAFVYWSLVLGLFWYVLHEVLDAIKAAGGFEQTKGVNVGVSVAGFGAQTSWFTAVAAAAIAIAALLVVAGYGAAWVANHSALFTIANSNPFSTSNPGIAIGLYLANSFFPLVESVVLFSTAMAFLGGLTVLMGTKAVVIRALPS